MHNKENEHPNTSLAQASADPWWRSNSGHKDPWGGWRGTDDVPMTVTPKLDSMEERLKGSIANSVTEATDARLTKMETDIHEMKQQHGQCQQWFVEAGQANSQMQTQINVLATQVTENKKELSSMGVEIKAGFANLKAMLAKKTRTE